MPNTLYSDETMNNKYTTNNEKANAIATHFENIHKLTYKSISVMEPIINNTYDSYDTNTPVTTFHEHFPANFKELNNNTQTTTTRMNASHQYQSYFISTKELTDIINTRNSKRTSGNDKSSNYVLKKMPEKFILTLTILLNHIINLQYAPHAWKFGVITAICKPKKNNALIPSYRPITQLSAISKLLEKKMDIRIRNHCELNKLINQYQFGFQPKKSTEIAVAKLITDIANGLNNRKPTIAILLDFQAAFDTIWHKALIYKMHIMKFDRNIICLVKNYLSNRSFSVKINNQMSTERKIVAGAPQGGILSAVIYLLYTNDFPQPSHAQTTINRLMFADDTILYAITNNIRQAKKDINSYLNKIANYVKCLKLKLNEKKTEQISIVGTCKDLSRGIRKQAQNIELKINNTRIEKHTKVKYLGIILSSNFQFKHHIDYILQKVNSTKAQLKSAFNNKHLNSNVKAIMYKQLIRPIILYACTCWMRISSNQMERIRRTERWFLRKITNLYRNHNTKKFINSKILYEKSNINRIDHEMIKNNIKVINKISNNENEFISSIISNNHEQTNTSTYKPINYFHQLNSQNRLIENNNVLIFNKGHRNPNRILYVTNQNDITT